MRTNASFLETFLVFLRLGLTSFGGPVAHLGYFHQELVVRRKWLDDHAFADIVALCQFLPGPASSQVGLAIGMHRAGWPGAVAAWLGFTLPSAGLMIGFAYEVGRLGNLDHAGWLSGLKLAALAVVAQAVWIMASKFCVGRLTASIAIGGAIIISCDLSGIAQIFVIALGAVLGWGLFRQDQDVHQPVSHGEIHLPYGTGTGFALLSAFCLLLFGLPILVVGNHSSAATVFNGFFRAGSFVFGGGHVVLPLLQTAVVTPGWVDNNKFLAGYGAAQALPGPLFSFAAYLGTVMKPQPNGWLGGLWCLLAIYVPAALLVFSSLPFWKTLRQRSFARAALKGANAAVVGVLLAALYNPVWTSAVHGPLDFIIALIAYGLLVFGKTPPWLMVIIPALAGAIFLG